MTIFQRTLFLALCIVYLVCTEGKKHDNSKKSSQLDEEALLQEVFGESAESEVKTDDSSQSISKSNTGVDHGQVSSKFA
jgi:hypothetical protein